jgi:hypothetical protein
VNNVEKNDNEITMDLNKLSFLNNLFENNFIPKFYGLLNFFNIRKISMSNELIGNNTSIYAEAMNKFGTITMDPTSKYIDDLYFSSYFVEGSKIDQLDSSQKETLYAGPPIRIQGCLYLDIESITFTNNSRISIGAHTATTPSEAISFLYSKGKINLGNFVVK